MFTSGTTNPLSADRAWSVEPYRSLWCSFPILETEETCSKEVCRALLGTGQAQPAGGAFVVRDVNNPLEANH